MTSRHAAALALVRWYVIFPHIKEAKTQGEQDSWVIELDPMNQKGRENRELYAHAGLALSLAQTLEHVLKNFIVLASAIERRRSQPPSTADDKARFNADLEKLEAETFKQTLGRLIKLVKSRFQFQAKPGLEADLSQSLIDRNQLVHHFFWDRALEQHSSQGRRNMAEELQRIQVQLRRTIEDFSEATNVIRGSLGITEEMIDEVVEAAKAGATEDEIREMVRKKRQPPTSRRA